MARKPLMAGNWKMNLTIAEAVELAQAVATSSNGLDDREVMIAPTSAALPAVAEALNGSSVKLATQNSGWKKQGAFTGENSPALLRDIGVSMTILGHSERRHIFGESDAMVNERLLGALQFGLSPVLCVGEQLTDREQGKTFTVVEQQLTAGLEGVGAEQLESVVIAYEPVWAIGTGKTASKEQAQEVHKFIREKVASLYEKTLAEGIRILYGGSVKPSNVDALMAQPDIDGALVGGAALDAESFDRIIKFI